MVEIGVSMGEWEWESHVEGVMVGMVSAMRGDGEGKTNNQPSSQERVSWQKKDKGFSQLAYL